MDLLLDHVVLEVQDVAASARFYERVLKMVPVRLAEHLAGEAPFASARVNAGTLIDFFPPPLWRNRRAARNPNHICFTVSVRELAALRRRLNREGVAIVRESPRNFGAQGHGRSFYFEDPDGISIEFRCYPEN